MAGPPGRFPAVPLPIVSLSQRFGVRLGERARVRVRLLPGWVWVFAAYVVVSAGTVGPRSVLLPIRRLRSPGEVAALDHELESVLSASFTGKFGRLASAFTMTVSEMCDNATTHGQPDVGFAYVAAQRIHPDRCVLAIGDLGMGIPDHIRRVYPELVRDEDAIREATLEGASGTGDPERGIGYRWVIDSLKETVVPDGDLRAWSGRGRFRVQVREGIQIRRRAWGVDQATPGTWVALSLKGGPVRRRTTVERRHRS